ncbi:hypothetical protein KC717_00400 [Candidatus Dojkabacteria bacterium]|uniref:Trigger factor n=1 Tax=Candidatus Dojkabacteria bacterium TaxID=2099670 RepID=A0A955L784_9BACT|nr:hypothetical protein [Candidatus Dojkabacteria bacterium]
MADDYSYKKEMGDDSEMALHISLDHVRFEKESDKKLKQLSKELSIKGFRKGNVPEHVAKAHLGPRVYEETLNAILPQITSEIVAKEKLEPITRVDYKVEKLDPKEGIEFSAKFTVFPEFKLGKISKIKVKKESAEVTDKDIQKVIDNMLEESEKKSDDKKAKKPKLDDEWVKTLGMENISTVDELKKVIKQTLESQKKQYTEEKYQADILQEAVKSSKVPVPEKIIELELDSRENDYRKRITDLNLDVDDFLRNQKSSMEELRKEWKSDVSERVATDLLLIKIIRENGMKIEPKEVDAEIEKLEDESMKEEYSNPRAKAQVADVMLRQKALKWILSEVEGK